VIRADPAPAAAAGGTLALAAAAWAVALRRMSGMDMGTATELGSPAAFAGVWLPMMAAMMLPGAVPAVVRRARAGGAAAAGFAASYLAVWALAGAAVYLLYRPHGDRAAALLLVGAGIYELTPFKRRCRASCRAGLDSGFAYGLWCVGSSAGLMAALLALGLMSVAWMAVVTVVVLAQKLMQPSRPVDAALAIALVGLGILIV
jgi:predicted metal-binding membrane protein